MIALQRAIDSYESMMVLDEYDVQDSSVNSTGFAGKRKKARPCPRTRKACDAAGFSYCEAMPGLTRPIVDRYYRKFALAHVMPRAQEEWQSEVMQDMVEGIEEGMRVLNFTHKQRFHKRGFWGVTNSGCGFGGGRKVELSKQSSF